MDGKREDREALLLADCESGDWARLESGWWRVGGPMAGGIGARPSRDGKSLIEDLGREWPAILAPDEPVLERRR